MRRQNESMWRQKESMRRQLSQRGINEEAKESMWRQMSLRGVDEAMKTDSSIVYKLTYLWHLPLFQSSQT